MRRLLLVVPLALLPASGLVFVACDGDDSSGVELADTGIAIDVRPGTSVDSGPGTGDSAAVDSGLPTDASGDGGDADAGADAASPCPHGLVFADGGILLTPTPYLDAVDSPFCAALFPTYFHRATFEGDAGLPPGVISAFGASVPTPGTHDGLIDSVDGDDGYRDGGAPDSGSSHPCFKCRSFFNAVGSQGIDFTFDEAVLGALPTHAGLVWTDGAASVTVTFAAYGADGGVLDTQVVSGIGDGANTGETAEDRFFGAVSPGGIKRITIMHNGGGIEIDHLQFGR